jgi:L-2-hydroxyglutarate oxidase LhgO
VDDDDIALLDRLKDYAEANGVGGVSLIGAKAARALEPELQCHAALFSEKSGIVDGHGLMLAYQGEIEANGGAVALNAVACGGGRTTSGYEVEIEIGSAERYTLSCDILINAAGLGAEAFATGLDFYPKARVPRVYFGKGSFFSYSGPRPFSRHISPLNSTLEMGGTYTVDLGGRAKFGPDFELVAEKDYNVDPNRRARFAAAIRRYFPGLDENRLQPDYAGNRPMLSAHRDVQLDDWQIDGPAIHGFPGLVHLFGISTPGLTSSIVLGDYVRSLL